MDMSFVLLLNDQPLASNNWPVICIPKPAIMMATENHRHKSIQRAVWRISSYVALCPPDSQASAPNPNPAESQFCPRPSLSTCRFINTKFNALGVPHHAPDSVKLMTPRMSITNPLTINQSLSVNAWS